MNILVFAGLTNKKLISKLLPIISNNNISKIYIVRKEELKCEKIICYSPKYKILKTPYLFEIYRIIVTLYLMIFRDINIIMGMQMVYHGIIGYYYAKVFNKKYIFNLVESYDKIKVSGMKVNVLKNSDLILTRGYKVIEDINKTFKFKIKPIYVPNYYLFSSNRIVNESKNNKVIYCGSFTPSKRIDILVSAINVVVNRHGLNDISIDLYGDGPLKQKIIEMIRLLNLGSYFNLFSYDENIEEKITNSKISIMTSEFEGQPMTIIESLGLGVPCIVPSISNIPDIAIHNYNALLVEPLDVDGFADAIYKLMTDDDLYNKLKAGAEKFRDEHEYEFSMENITNIWNQIFKQLGLTEEENVK